MGSGKGRREISVPFSHICFKPKTALKIVLKKIRMADIIETLTKWVYNTLFSFVISFVFINFNLNK